MLLGILTRVGRRLLASIPALLGVVVVTFILMRVLPGDPAVFFASGPSAGKAEIEELRQKMGLDKPVPVQLAIYLGQGRHRQSRALHDDGPAGLRPIWAAACRLRWN